MKKTVRILSVGILLTSIAALYGYHSAGSAEYKSLENVSVCIATDLHYLSPELTDDGTAFQTLIQNSDGKAMEICETIIDSFLSQALAEWPDVLILSGDLTFNGERVSHEALCDKLSQVESAGIPVLVIPGNHDLENPMAASFHGDDYESASSLNANAAYFAGRPDRIDWKRDTAENWTRQYGFCSAYLQSIRNEGPQNHTEFQIFLKRGLTHDTTRQTGIHDSKIAL